MSINMGLLFADAFEVAEKFVASYYDILDNKRLSWNVFYKENSTMVFNGNLIKGLDSINTFQPRVPTSRTTVSTVNSHPLPFSTYLNGPCCIQVFVSGTISFGGEKKAYPFSQIFLLSPDPQQANAYFIANDTFRLV
ncbi:NTF2-like protein [Neoconidiobolus thromboides FSU 785]|nr:NTF2-like protein [Neoconidiobolus thromboides FSU 785]